MTYKQCEQLINRIENLTQTIGIGIFLLVVSIIVAGLMVVMK